MRDESKEARMLPLTEQVWNEFLPDNESLFAYIFKMDLPIYFKVDQVRHLVYRFFQKTSPPVNEAQRKYLAEIPWMYGKLGGSDTTHMPARGFHNHLSYLRLDNASLDEIAQSSSCSTPAFSRWGLGPERKYRKTGEGAYGVPIMELEKLSTVSDLKKIEFDKALVINKLVWEQMKRAGERGDNPYLSKLLVKTETRLEELFLDSIDVSKLKDALQKQVEQVPYPFEHRERMPGIYWMFQAAHRLNEQKKMEGGKQGVQKWLRSYSGKDVYKHRSIRTATKFVWLDLDRNKGGYPRGEVDVDKIKGWADEKTSYRFNYVGMAFSIILAIADWWVARTYDEPDVSRVILAEKLLAHDFGGLEVGDLVYLISGKRITDEDEVEIKTRMERNGKKLRGIRDGEIRGSATI